MCPDYAFKMLSEKSWMRLWHSCFSTPFTCPSLAGQQWTAWKSICLPDLLPLRCLCPGLTLGDNHQFSHSLSNLLKRKDVLARITGRLASVGAVVCSCPAVWMEVVGMQRNSHGRTWTSALLLSHASLHLTPRTLWCDGNTSGFLTGPQLLLSIGSQKS